MPGNPRAFSFASVTQQPHFTIACLFSGVLLAEDGHFRAHVLAQLVRKVPQAQLDTRLTVFGSSPCP